MFTSRIFPTIKRIKQRILCLLTTRLLTIQAGPETISSEHHFSYLQDSFSPLPEYGYDEFSTWNRAVKRAIFALNYLDIQNPGLLILDAACGDGMLGVLLNSYGHQTLLTDLEDWRDIRAKQLPFYKQQLENLREFRSDQFDLIFSFNSFEHLADPRVAFDELVRVCKPGGGIYLEFGPLYNGPWGLHAYRSLRMPYPQYLFSEEFLNQKLLELGINDLGRESPQLQPLNRWKFHDFVSLWDDHPLCECIFQDRIRNEKYLEVILRYPKAFQVRGLTYLDLTTQGIMVFVKKRDG